MKERNDVQLSQKKDLNFPKASMLSDAVHNFLRHKLAVISLIVIVLEMVLVFIVPLFIDLQPNKMQGTFFGAPTSDFLLGTDELGRDVFARLLYGGRMSLLIGLAAATLSALIGIPLGVLAGYYNNALRAVILRVTDMFMSIPMMIAAMFIVSVVGTSMWTVIVVIGFLGWPGFCRLAYGRVLSVKENEYIEAARAIGTTTRSLIFKYILPNSMAPLLVAYSMSVASAIVTESSLSFLGIGIQPPQASLGNMLYSAQSLSTLTNRWWMWLPAGILLVATVLSINFIGDGLRDALDPKMKI